MNYYNPYFSSMPYMNTISTPVRGGMFSKLFKGVNFSSILSGTQKTLNIVNQTIPLVKQAQPIINNAKTMFKVMNEFKKIDTPSNTNNTVSSTKDTTSQTVDTDNYSNYSGPTFFI